MNRKEGVSPTYHHHFDVIVLCGQVERRVSAVVTRVDIAAADEEQLDSFSVPLPHGVVNWHEALRQTHKIELIQPISEGLKVSGGLQIYALYRTTRLHNTQDEDEQKGKSSDSR